MQFRPGLHAPGPSSRMNEMNDGGAVGSPTMILGPVDPSRPVPAGKARRPLSEPLYRVDVGPPPNTLSNVTNSRHSRVVTAPPAAGCPFWAVERTWHAIR